MQPLDADNLPLDQCTLAKSWAVVPTLLKLLIRTTFDIRWCIARRKTKENIPPRLVRQTTGGAFAPTYAGRSSQRSEIAIKLNFVWREGRHAEAVRA